MNDAPFLLVDAGNSRIKWALVQADGTRMHVGAFAHVGGVGVNIGTAAGASDDGNTDVNAGTSPCASPNESPPGPLDPDAPLACTPDWSALPRPRSAWISNVAGDAAARRIDALIDAHWPALPRTTVRACARQCGVSNGYAAPGTLGSDRWASLIGARAAFPGEPLLLATFGTATTLEALRADGTFVGGLIAPGWALMMRALGENTAQLPALDAHTARGLIAPPAQTLPFFATDTPGSISTGCALAQAGLIERIWADLQQAWAMPVRLVVSGGGATNVGAVLKAPHTYHESLVLAGLAVIAAWPRQFDRQHVHWPALQTDFQPVFPATFQPSRWPEHWPATWPAQASYRINQDGAEYAPNTPNVLNGDTAPRA